MLELSEIKIDSKEVEKKLNGTTLRMNTIIVKMQNAVNREAIKRAKSDFKVNFNRNNHNHYVLEGKTKEILKGFKTRKSKKLKGSTQVKNISYHAKFLELGAKIKAKNGKYLTFKVNGEWKKVESVTLPARPFLGSNLKNIWNSPEAKAIQEKVLDKELEKYWKKQGVK